MAPLHPRTSTLLTIGLAFSITLVVGCPGSEIRERAEATVESPTVRFTAPLQDEQFLAINGTANISSEILATLPTAQDTLLLSLDGVDVGTLRASDVQAGVLLDRRFDFQFPQVGIGLHSLTVQAASPDGPYMNPEASDAVDIFVITSCDVDADCNDDNLCSEERCVGGSCTYLKVTTFPCVPNVPGDTSDTDAGGNIDFPCKEDSDCPDKYPEEFGNLGNCAVAFCDDIAKECRTLNTPTGLPCEDGDLCTAGDKCDKGECIPGTPAICDDGDPCTIDSCDSALGCHSEPDNILCVCLNDLMCAELDDGNPCNGVLRCSDDFQCVTDPATVPDCGEANGCFEGVCNPGTGACDTLPVADGTLCDDGDACTSEDICTTGDCSGVEADCDDGNLCTVDACDPATGCTNTATAGIPCEDGNNCTLEDFCTDAGTCVGGQNLLCDDANLCTVDACDPVLGCLFDPVPLNSTPCDDDNACTGPGSCFEGFCVVPLVDCDDDNPCTADSCNEELGCETAPLDGTACDDGNECTSNDQCVAGVCQGEGLTCDDSNPCTDDTCTIDGGCQFTPNAGACDDGNECTFGDQCVAGSCQPGDAVVCDDSNPCTDDSCDPASGCVNTNNTAACDDGTACTTGDTCVDGACVGAPLDCTDGNVCTDDLCDAVDGCQFPNNTAPCDDGEFCTINDTCVDGACTQSDPNPACENIICEISGQAGDEVVCDLNMIRTSQLVPIPAALQFKMMFNNTSLNLLRFQDELCFGPCFDANIPVDSPTVSTGHTLSLEPPLATNWNALGEGNAIMVNLSDPSSAVSAAYIDTDTSVVGEPLFLQAVFTLMQDVPAPTPSYVTVDNVVISDTTATVTLDWFVQDLTIYVDADITCNPDLCDDGDPCTLDTCDAAGQDCIFVPQTGTPCDDGNACTIGDQCDAGVCTPGTDADCNDNNVCTTDGCDPATGCANVNADGAPCDDGDACTGQDSCLAGACTGTAITCDDANVCTDDSCDSTLGCQFNNNTAACDDGDFCTINDTCLNGACSVADPNPACENIICEITGIAGDEVVCPLNMIRTSQFVPVPAGVQFKMLFDNAAVTLLRFQDEICFGIPGPCMSLSLPDETPTVSTGHQLALQPPVVADWNVAGNGSAILVHLSQPTTPVSDAYIEADGITVTGEALFMEAVFQLQVDIDSGLPSFVNLADVFVTSPDAEALDNYIQDLTIYVDGEVLCDPSLCDDGDPCTLDTCNAAGSACQFTPQTGTPCEDGDACTINDLCNAGFCTPGTAADCDDGNICTTDGCDPATGCTAVPLTNAPCDDGNACTADDTCSAGSCQPGASLNCDDGNVCTTDSCDPATGCANTANTSPCDDGNACTSGDACAAGSCQPGNPVTCEDGNACTTDSCDPATGCANTANNSPCDDGNACTSGDACAAGSCQPGSPVSCDDSNVCTTDSCDPATGCSNIANNSTCDDGNACTDGDICSAGTCAGVAIGCDDGDQCTVDTCDPATGCVNTAAAIPCDDGEFCTIDDVCDLQGTCAGATPNPDCADTACKLEGTAGATVICNLNIARVAVTVPLPAALQFDLNFDVTQLQLDKFQDEICLSADPASCFMTDVPPSLLSTGHQVSIFPTNPAAWPGNGTALVVNLSDPTAGVSEAYLDGLGAMQNDPLFMQAVFTVVQDLDAANPGLVTYSNIVVSTSDASAMDYFVADDIIYVNADSTCDPLACDDGNPCTIDTCDAASDSCVSLPNNGAPCDDGDACTTGDQCTAGACVGTALNCDDGNACNGTETCDAATGCVPGAALQCDDGNACTTDSCDPASGCANSAVDCNDGVACTDDGCDPVLGCTNAANDANCSDGDACNGAETCDAVAGCQLGTAVNCDDGDVCNGTETCNSADGSCAPGTALNCDDGSACTVDSCDPATGCSNVATGCDDGIACTVDSCDDALGCVYTATDSLCDDADACNGTETCDAGSGCQAGTPVNCDDNNVCNGTETCNSADGTCTAGTALTCDDNNVCNGSETCDAALGCQAGTALDCDDAIACTADACDPATGCTNTENDSACDDGDVCNGEEVCNGAVGCEAGSTLDCSDGDACTDDSCSAATGCINTATVCDDGIACTTDGCDPASGCTATPVHSSCDDGNACTDDLCDVATGCTTAPTNCDDGDLCTIDTCDSATGCASSNVTCDDGDVCTDDFCDPGTGLCDTTFNTAPCNDDDFCTINDACLNGVCEQSDPNPACANAVCEVFGNAGDEVACPLQLARLTQATSLPVGLQFNVAFNGTQLEALRYTDIVNIPGIGDVEAEVPPQNLSTGHQVNNFPSSMPSWNDLPGNPNAKTSAVGSTLLANISNPTQFVTDAYFQTGALQGDALFMTLHVQLLQTIPDTAPALVFLDQIVATTAAAEPLQGVVANKIIVVFEDAECIGDGECDNGDPCTVGTCNVSNGLCVQTPAADGTPCDDGNAATANDQCTAGVCAGSSAVNCDDSNPCTADAPDGLGGCVNTPVDGGSCDDGDDCTTGDVCTGGSCVGTAGAVCDDGNPCTDDICSAGSCSFVDNAAPCDDGNLCTVGDACGGGSCQTGAPMDCADNFVCDGILECNPATGACEVNISSIPFCGDGILQSECGEECDDGGNVPGDGCGISCKLEPCIPGGCDDGNPCTTDTCNAGLGCQFVPNSNPCDDGNACTLVDTCSSGVCAGGAPIACDDGVACTDNSCNPATGCQFVENDANCEDGEPCTTNLCNAAAGCEVVPIANGTACNDGNACTVGETCGSGICGAGSALNCNDGNPCTSDNCNPAAGCTHSNLNGNPCQDGDPCTANDQCTAGVCKPGTYVVSPPSCPPIDDGSVVCELIGNSGDTVDCELELAAADITEDFGTGLQFTMQFDRKIANLVNFYDNKCFGAAGCFDVPVIGAGGQPLSTGHSMSIAPVSIALWNGTPCSAVAPCAGANACVNGLCENTGGYGAVVLVNLTNPSAALSTAYLDAGGNVVGDPGFVTVRFLLVDDAIDPVEVVLGNVQGAQKDSLSLNVTVIDKLLVTSAP